MKLLSAHTELHSRNKRNSIPLFHRLITALVIVFFCAYDLPAQEEVLQESSPVTIVLVGDIMFDRGVRRNIEKHYDSNYGVLYEHAPYLKESDITFGNLEGSVASPLIGKRVGGIYSFRMDPKGLRAMKEAGFDIVSFANNHVGDYSRSGFEETLRLLKEEQILYAGAGETKEFAHAPTIIDVRGTTIGFLAATDVGPNWMKAGSSTGTVVYDQDFLSAVRRADIEVDVLVVSMHWGEEYAPANARQKKIARNIIDAGADILVGHHPHVMQEIEMYNGKPIFYSLGNYIFDQYFSSHTMRGMVVKASIEPETKSISYEAFISPLSKRFIPQSLVPFNESLLVQKPFYP